MLNQIKLKQLKNQDKIDHFLLLSNFSIKAAKTGKNFLDLELRDETISLNAKMWSGFESIVENLKTGIVLKINGIVDEFNNQLQIKIERLKIADKNDNITIEDFLPKSKQNLEEMEMEFKMILNSIKSKYLTQLLKNIFTEENFNKYRKVPAGKSWHHAYISGLFEHTLEIIKICELMCKIHQEANRDLLVTGAILHDFGKIEELDFSTGFDYTDKGKLVGHIVIAANIIEKETRKIENFPEEIKNQLLHIVLSHQGKLEFASPVIPKTLEAIILYHADELSAKANAYKNAIISEKESGNSWTKYLPLAETSLYVKEAKEINDDFKETLF
ncbi:MAG: HD domain-containing protein [Ignavibacteriae bacterium]|nr:HD domain-containing protein [Ignavibacteriota bacterium]